MVLTWRVCFCEGNKGGLNHLIPSCHCGRGCMYCRAGCHSNSCGVRKSCFPALHPPPPPPPSLLSLSVQYLVRFLPLSLSPSLSLPRSPTCTDMVCRVLGGECSGMRSHTHTHTYIICLCAAGGADEGTMSLKKRLSFKRTWNFNTVSKLWFAEQVSSYSAAWSRETPFVQSAVFLINLTLWRSPIQNSCLKRRGLVVVCLRGASISLDLCKS